MVRLGSDSLHWKVNIRVTRIIYYNYIKPDHDGVHVFFTKYLNVSSLFSILNDKKGNTYRYVD